MKYYVRLTREPITDGEVAWAARFRKSESHPIIFHYYARNLVLGNDEEVAEPEFFWPDKQKCWIVSRAARAKP